MKQQKAQNLATKKGNPNLPLSKTNTKKKKTKQKISANTSGLASKKSVSQTHARNAMEDIESLDLKRTVSVFGERIHGALSRIPKALRISKKDSIDMYQQIDTDARIRSYPYWLFVIASCGIATLGLIINSPAVIIGAMLVSPLMGPIIGLGMGVAINDIYLSVKSIINIALSLAVAILTSAFISLVVPLHEPTPEILARTNPTLLDLFIALFCGLVAALSSVRSNNHEVLKSVAPGAAIGVALMPPICVIGFGLGTGFNWKMMWGSFLLFMTNLMAIVLVSSFFYYFIYNQYSVRKMLRLLEPIREKEEALYKGRFQPLWSTWNQNTGFGYRRFIFPALMILAISYPLMSSLLFLKRQVNISLLIEERLKQEIPNIQILRGTENLVFTRDGLSGNILFSSPKTSSPEFTERLKKEIETRFDGYAADLRLVRIADASELNKLRLQTAQKQARSLENSPNTLHDAVRHAYASDLVKRALELLVLRFPSEIGLIQKIRVSFSPQGMDTIFVHYVGKRMSAETQTSLSVVYKQEILALQGNIQSLKLIYEGPKRNRFGCRKKPFIFQEKHIHLALQKTKEIMEILQENPYIGLSLRSSKEVVAALKKEYSKDTLKNIHTVEALRPICLLEYEYLRR